MPFDLQQLLAAHAGQGHDLFGAYVNPQLARVLATIGFNKNYVRAQGPYLYDAEGNDYLDLLSGYGVFNMGRNHPKIRAALKEAITPSTASRPDRSRSTATTNSVAASAG